MTEVADSPILKSAIGWTYGVLKDAFPIPPGYLSSIIFSLFLGLCFGAMAFATLTRGANSNKKRLRIHYSFISVAFLLFVCVILTQWVLSERLLVFHTGSNCLKAGEASYVSVVPISPSDELRPYLKDGAKEFLTSCEYFDEYARAVDERGIHLTVAILSLAYFFDIACTSFILMAVIRALWLLMPSVIKKRFSELILSGNKGQEKNAKEVGKP